MKSPAPKDGVVTEILVSNEEMVEFGKGLVRIKWSIFKESKKLFPHRYPMLLVDRVLEVSEDTIVAIKNVTINEPFFNGHFPQYPVMPGVLIMEAFGANSWVCWSCLSLKIRGN